MLLAGFRRAVFASRRKRDELCGRGAMSALQASDVDFVGPAVRRLSILQIGAGWFPEFCAGGENVFYHLAKYLPQVGVSVRGLVVGSEAVGRQTNHRIDAFAPREAPLIRRLRNERKAIARIFERNAPDLVAVHMALFALPVVDRLGPRPLVIHFHGPWAAESVVEGGSWISVKIKAAVERFAYARANCIIVLSQAFGELLTRSYGVSPERIRVIPGGVECARFHIPESRREARERLGWDTGKPTVLAVRRLARRMGLSELIASMVELRRSVPDIRLMIAGKGDEAPRLQRLIQELQLDDTVRLMGFVPEHLLPLAYRAADLSVVPSTAFEGFGLPTAESLAAGTPVMVTPVGGLPETVRALHPGLIFSGHAPSQIALGLRQALIGRMALPTEEQCRSFARRCFDWPIVAARTREAYVDALS
jgi:glycosyltransferase involved in cell wall biosynthesis